MPPNNPHAFQLTPLPFLPPQTAGKSREGGADSPQLAPSIPFLPGASPAGRGAGRAGRTRSCRLRSAFLSTRQVSTSPARSPTAVVGSSCLLFQPLFPAAAEPHRRPRAPCGCVAQLFPELEVTSRTPPPPSPASPHGVYEIRGLERRGK